MATATQLSLIDEPATGLPAGFEYRGELVTPVEEDELIEAFRALDFRPFEFHGYFGNRRTVSFGWHYDFASSRVRPASDMPEFLLPLRDRAAAFARLPPDALEHALITEYAPGAGIGWHRDRPVFDDVIGLSFGAPCRFRLRRKQGDAWQRAAIELRPRSAYLLRGPVRLDWEHSIPPLDQLRYSVTFRSVKPSAKSAAR
ncbi:MAG TPA: alpha-ketoglutarate-dependent dioxygenase AlkB [Stellaceae bacterium]|jgi:alkylated DNA repair dioxygenase AlkB